MLRYHYNVPYCELVPVLSADELLLSLSFTDLGQRAGMTGDMQGRVST